MTPQVTDLAAIWPPSGSDIDTHTITVTYFRDQRAQAPYVATPREAKRRNCMFVASQAGEYAR